MTRDRITLEQLVDTLHAEQLLTTAPDALDHLPHHHPQQPWYIRTLVGFGAWLASLLLIGFVAGLGVSAGGGYSIIGILLIVAAILGRRIAEGDFLIQCAMASSLAGQALLAYGITDAIGYEKVEVYLGVALVVSLILLLIYPDRIHRVLMLLLAVGCTTGLFYTYEAQVVIPFFAPLLTGLLLLLQLRTPKLASGRIGPLLQPLTSGLMLGAFGVLMLSTLYLLPELGVETDFYPRPWISTLLLGAELLYLAWLIGPAIVENHDSRQLTLLYGVLILVIALAWYAPGLILSLIVLLLSTHSGRATFVGAGIGFFALFLAAFFYGIEVSLLTKSYTLIASGAALLLTRWVLLRTFRVNDIRESGHA
jgi:MFS family permease